MKLKEFWVKFDGRLFCIIYSILFAITICGLLIGFGCDESPNPNIWCKVIFAILFVSYYAIASILVAAMEFLKIDSGPIVLFVSLAIHSLIYAIAVTKIRIKLDRRKTRAHVDDAPL